VIKTTRNTKSNSKGWRIFLLPLRCAWLALLLHFSALPSHIRWKPWRSLAVELCLEPQKISWHLSTQVWTTLRSKTMRTSRQPGSAVSAWDDPGRQTVLSVAFRPWPSLSLSVGWTWNAFLEFLAIELALSFLQNSMTVSSLHLTKNQVLGC